MLLVKTKYGTYTELGVKRSVKSRVLRRTVVRGRILDCQSAKTWPQEFHRLRGFSPREALYPSGVAYNGLYRVVYVPVDPRMRAVYSKKVSGLLK